MCVQALKGIKRPGDLIESVFQRAFALCELQVKTRLEISVFRSHCEHVRMDRRVARLKAREPVRKADHELIFKCAQHDASSVLSCDHRRSRNDIQIAEFPSLALDVF